VARERFELFDGERLYGVFPSRRFAMADAELLAAKRGQRVHWSRSADGEIVGELDPVRSDLPFTVQPVAGAPWSKPRHRVARHARKQGRPKS
jgi:hypothetical protein